MSERNPVVVVGAGPTGLMCALALGQQGIPVTLFEAEPGLTQDLRAGSFHPPTLDMMVPYGVSAKMHETGIRARSWQIRDRLGDYIIEFDVGLLADVTLHPYRLLLEQHRLTAILLDIIRTSTGVDVRFSNRVCGIKQRSDCVAVEVDAGGEIKEIAASWVVGADGGRSAVRKLAGFAFEGFTWPEKFLVTGTSHDLGQHGYDQVAYVADPKEWVAIFHMPHSGPPGVWRLVFPVSEAIGEAEALSDPRIERRMQNFLPRGEPWPIAYRGLYSVHQRVSRTFNVGRVLLAGDAAHLNNPLGGFGLNSGIHDAINLAEKLGRVFRDEAVSTLLDLYSRQRRAVTVEHIQEMSIRNKKMLEQNDPAARRRQLAELGDIARDPKRAREYVYASSMLLSLERANQIT